MKINDYVKLNMDFIKRWGVFADNSSEKKIGIDLPFSTTDTYIFVEKNKQNAVAERCQRINNNIIDKIYDAIDKEYNNEKGEYLEYSFDEKKYILTITDLKF